MKIVKTTDKISTRLKGFNESGYDLELSISKCENQFLYSVLYTKDNIQTCKSSNDLDELLNSIDEYINYESICDKDIYFIKSNLEEGYSVGLHYTNKLFNVELIYANVNLKYLKGSDLNPLLKELFA